MPPTPAPPIAPAPPLLPDPEVRVSTPSTFATGCTGTASTGTTYVNAEVEPHVAVNPVNQNNLIAAWQQDRWSDGGASGTLGAVSMDGGSTWTVTMAPFSRCSGGNTVNGGDYARATDPWVTFAANGTAYQMALSINGGTFAPGSGTAMLVARSTNGGLNWSSLTPLIVSGSTFFNDKNTITADPLDANYVYAVWDRLASTGGGPLMFARTTDGGLTWEAARNIYDPGVNSQTIGGQIVVLPSGVLLAIFTQLDPVGAITVANLNLIRSTDRGATWTSTPIRIADMRGIGARDPDTGTVIRDGAIIPQMAVAPNGTAYTVWQDARFSNGARDGIALARSTDAGLTWSAPVQVNSVPAAVAFTPSIHVRADGTIGVTYFDLRSNTSDPLTLPTEAILARSSNGTTWRENSITGSFNLANAPALPGGLFLGDYMGLSSSNGFFVPVYVRTNATTANRTDVYAVVARSAAVSNAGAGASFTIEYRAAGQSQDRVDPQFQQRIHDNVKRVLERRRDSPGSAR
jgi:hypothetical protein